MLRRAAVSRTTGGLDWRRGVFAWDEEDHGMTDVLYHHISTGTATPFKNDIGQSPQACTLS